MTRKHGWRGFFLESAILSIIRSRVHRLAALTILAMFLLPAYAQTNETLDLSQYRGKVVVVDFWASWCVPCRRSFPWMNEMQAKYGDDGLVFLAVNTDNEASEAQAFLDEFPADFKIIYDDADNSLAR